MFFLLGSLTTLLMEFLFALSKACRLYYSARKISSRLILFFYHNYLDQTSLSFIHTKVQSHMHAHSHRLVLFTTYFRGNMT